MFSSNQQLQISGRMRDLAQDIAFAMRKAGCDEMFTREKNPCVCGYQITNNGLYVIGNMGSRAVRPKREFENSNFTPYPFDYDPEIIAKIAEQWLRKQPHINPEFDEEEGGHDLGYLLQDIWSLDYETKDHINDIFDAVICLRPYKNYYAK